MSICATKRLGKMLPIVLGCGVADMRGSHATGPQLCRRTCEIIKCLGVLDVLWVLSAMNREGTRGEVKVRLRRKGLIGRSQLSLREISTGTFLPCHESFLVSSPALFCP